MTRTQTFERVLSGIPVTVDSVDLTSPFTGGIDAPQHQFVDIDGDADLDLYVFDRDGIVDFYRNTGSGSAHNFLFDTNAVALPSFLFWFDFVDLNVDGRIDLCTDDSATGVRWYRNVGTAQTPSFVQESPGLVDSSGNPVFAGFSSIPAFADIDGDGLPDFLSSNSADGSINYYKNIGTVASPLFKLMTTTFQGLTVIGDTCLSSMYGLNKPTSHGAGNVRLADFDGNGTQDLFYGDQFSRGVFLMKNIGTPTQPLLECTTNRFPFDGSLVTNGFNQPNFVDIDGDGDMDLFVGVLNTMQRHGFWFYKNEGTPTAPEYRLQTRDFISTMDIGSFARPSLVDIDGDGALDVIAGSLDGKLWFYRNDGTTTLPSLTLADTLFGGVTGNFTYAPAFTDIDHDGDVDLFVGRFDGRVKFYRNIGTSVTPQFTPEIFPSDTIVVGLNASPAFVDIDGDGDADCFVGKGNGQVAYYRNIGDSTTFLPLLVSSTFDGIDVGDDATPAFVDIDRDGDYDFFIGNAGGQLYFYENTGSAVFHQFNYQSSSYGSLAPLSGSAPTFGDFDGDGDSDLLVGTSTGGFHFYRNDALTSVHDDGRIPLRSRLSQNYPNPFNPSTEISFVVDHRSYVSLKIFDILGREVAGLIDGSLPQGSYHRRWESFGFPSGVYYYRLVIDAEIITRSMILSK